MAVQMIMSAKAVGASTSPTFRWLCCAANVRAAFMVNSRGLGGIFRPRSLAQVGARALSGDRSWRI